MPLHGCAGDKSPADSSRKMKDGSICACISVAEIREQRDPGDADEPGAERGWRVQLRGVGGCAFLPHGHRFCHHERRW